MPFKLTRVLLFCFLCLVFIQTLNAQDYLPFTTIDKEKGLPNNNVTSIVQDSVGFIWIGTKNGLSRFDGTSFQHLDPNTTKLTSNDISDLLFEDHRQLWIATAEEGINKLDIKSNKIESYSVNESDGLGLKSNSINRLYKDIHNSIWVASDVGLSKYQPSDNSFTTFINPSPHENWKGNAITALAQKSPTQLWVGTKGEGLFVFDATHNNFTSITFGFTSKEFIHKSLHITAIQKVDSTKLLLGTSDNGLFVFNIDTQKLSKGKPKKSSQKTIQKVSSITRGIKGNIWVATDGEGIFKFSRNDTDFQQPLSFNTNSKNNSNIQSNAVNTIFWDKDSNMWLGTVRKGLAISEKRPDYLKFLPNGFLNTNSFPALSILQSNDNIIIGTDGDGLYQKSLDPLSKSNRQLLPLASSNAFIQTIQPFAKNQYWLGTYKNGLMLVNRSQEIVEQYGTNIPGKILSHNNVREVFMTPSKNLWVATWGGGLNYIDRKSQKITFYQHQPSNPKSISSNDVTTFTNDPFGSFWVATYGGGLNRLNLKERTFDRYQCNNQNLNFIFSMALDLEGKCIWMGTKGGLLKFDLTNHTSTPYKVGNSETTNYVTSVQVDDNGNVWMGTRAGIYIKRAKSERISYVKKTFQEHLINSSFKDGNGKLYFGGLEGVTVIYPSQFREIENDNPIVFTSFKQFHPTNSLEKEKISPIAISYQNAITLPYNSTPFTIEYSSLEYPSTIVSYWAKMENFDSDWKSIHNQNSLTYSDLNPGEYVFRIKEQRENFDSKESQLRIKILPPFWQRGWFYGLILFLGVSLLFIIRYYWNRWRSINKELKILRNKISDFNYKDAFPLNSINGTISDSEFLNKLNNIIKETILENPCFKVRTLSEKMNMSHSALYKKIKELTNMSISEFVRDYRLNLASKLLEHPNVRVSEVSFLVGYNDAKYFSKEFKKKFKQTPSEYLKKTP
jgi:ligand-binding sensor domain-containing protein/AraC-like DNA-binding protein